MKFESIIQLPSAWTCIAGRIGLHLFQGELTVDDMDRLEAVGNEWFSRNPGKLVEISVIFPSNARLSTQERQRMAKLIKRWENTRTAAATVILADGMLGALQRSMLTGMLMIVPPPHPSKIFSSVRDAVRWLTPHARELAGSELTEGGLFLAVTNVCDVFQAR